jgi:hypothetical protein
MIAVEVKGADPKYTWETVGIYRAPYDDTQVIERLAARTGYLRNSTKRSIIGGDLNLPQADWKGNAEGTNETQVFLNRLVWDKGYTQVVGSPTRADALLDVYLDRPEESLISCNIVPGISDHCAVLLEVDWDIAGPEPQIVPVYNKTDISGLKTFLREKFLTWADME